MCPMLNSPQRASQLLSGNSQCEKQPWRRFRETAFMGFTPLGEVGPLNTQHQGQPRSCRQPFTLCRNLPQQPPHCGSVSAACPHTHLPARSAATMGMTVSGRTLAGVEGGGVLLSSHGPQRWSTGLPSVPASLIPNAGWQALWLRGRRIRVWRWH